MASDCARRVVGKKGMREIPRRKIAGIEDRKEG